MKQLSTTAEVIDALSVAALCEMFGVGYSAVWNWRKEGEFPGYTALAMKSALNAADFDAPSNLWKSSIKTRKRSSLVSDGAAQ